MDFQERLQQAIDRGHKSRHARDQAEAEKALSAEELKNRHSSARLNLCEHIESSLKQLTDHFPGFRFETILDDGGWGARISRDDLRLRGSRRANQYSRFEMLVRPWSEQTKIVEIVAKGTINNAQPDSLSVRQGTE